MSDDIEESRFAELEALGREYAQAKAQADYMDEFTKSKLAILMKEAEVRGATSAALQEREARRDQEFIAFLEGKRAAVEKSETLRYRLEVKKMRFEYWRTMNANRRAEMNLR